MIIVGRIGIACLAIGLAAHRRRPTDASHLHESPSDGVATAIEELTSLGFERMGEVQIRLPFVIGPATTWVLADRDQTTCAEVVKHDRTDAMVGLSSTYPDGAVVETGYPQGERILDCHFESHTITTTLEEAYRYHLGRTAAFGLQHGMPLRYESISDYLRHDDAYRIRHMARKHRRLTVNTWTSLAATAYGVVAFSVFVLSQQWSSDLPLSELERRMTLLSGLLGPAAALGLVMSQIVASGSHRDSRKGLRNLQQM
jgi:hypothetical protein